MGSFFPRPKLQEVLESTTTVFLMRLKVTIMQSLTTEEEPIVSGVREPVVTFVEPDQMPEAKTIKIEPTPLVQSVSTMSDVTDVTKPVDGELTTTVLSLFDDNIRTLYTQEVDFFSTISTLCGIIPGHIQIPHQNWYESCNSELRITIWSRVLIVSIS